jgi:hypothetical protein
MGIRDRASKADRDLVEGPTITRAITGNASDGAMVLDARSDSSVDGPDATMNDNDQSIVDEYLAHDHERVGEEQYEVWRSGVGEPFDFPGRSYLDEWTGALREKTDLMRRFEERVAVERKMMTELGNWPLFDAATLAFIAELDEAIHLTGDDFLRQDPAFLDDLAKVKLCAAGSELSRIRKPGLARAGVEFWGRLHEMGPIPEMIREANHLLALRSGDADFLDGYGDLRRVQATERCLEFHPAVRVGSAGGAVARDIEESCEAGVAQMNFRIGALDEREIAGVPLNLNRALVARDWGTTEKIASRLNAAGEAAARKHDYPSFTAFEIERIVHPAGPDCVVDTSFLRIRVIERATPRRAHMRSIHSISPRVSRRSGARTRTSHARSKPTRRHASSRSSGGGDDDGGGGGSDPSDPFAKPGTATGFTFSATIWIEFPPELEVLIGQADDLTVAAVIGHGMEPERSGGLPAEAAVREVMEAIASLQKAVERMGSSPRKAIFLGVTSSLITLLIQALLAKLGIKL